MHIFQTFPDTRPEELKWTKSEICYLVNCKTLFKRKLEIIPGKQTKKDKVYRDIICTKLSKKHDDISI